MASALREPSESHYGILDQVTSPETITMHRTTKDIIGKGIIHYTLYSNNPLVICSQKLGKAHLGDRPADNHAKPCFAIGILLRGLYTHQYLLDPNAHAITPCMRS